MAIDVSVLFESRIVPSDGAEDTAVVKFYDNTTGAVVFVPMDLFGEVAAAIFSSAEEQEQELVEPELPFEEAESVSLNGGNPGRNRPLLRAARADG